jgi:hypothetical protein
MYNPASNNRATNNRYWYPMAENGWWRFMWAGGVSYLTDFNHMPGGTGSQYLTDAQRDQILESAGIPNTPDSLAAFAPPAPE